MQSSSNSWKFIMRTVYPKLNKQEALSRRRNHNFQLPLLQWRLKTKMLWPVENPFRSFDSTKLVDKPLSIAIQMSGQSSTLDIYAAVFCWDLNEEDSRIYNFKHGARRARAKDRTVNTTLVRIDCLHIPNSGLKTYRKPSNVQLLSTETTPDTFEASIGRTELRKG